MAEARKGQRRAIEQRLGAALFDAVGMLVRQYFEGGEEEIETGEAAANAAFDESRFFALSGGEMSESYGEKADESLLAEGDFLSREYAPLRISPRVPEGEAYGETKREEGEKSLFSARGFSDRLERETRRYDGGFAPD